MVTSAAPAISVIIPTYNWSAALRLAIRSVLLQTMQDFELFVIGDGCTDDSEQVVRSFQDSRISWHSLDRNYGSQWAANNLGIGLARADLIAYLGHDDIWYPTHLEAILRTARETGADVVTSIMALYGPRESGSCGVAGLFPTGVYTARDFVPPSAFAHTKQICTEHRWQDPADVDAPIDMVFINTSIALAKKAASTRELTCFKFNAAWRRDVYKLKTVEEQEKMLARVESGIDFRSEELFNVIQAAVSDRLIRVRLPTVREGRGFVFERNRKYKGAQQRFAESELVTVSRPMRFDMRKQDMPFEWHPLEYLSKDRLLRATGLRRIWPRRTFRWTGPSRRSTIDLPIRFDRNLRVCIGVMPPLKPAILETLVVSVHGQPVSHRITKKQGRNIEIEADILRDAIVKSDRDFGVTLEVGEVARPCDVSDSQDTRTVGLPVQWIELRPLTNGSGR
jgi:glycosyltransferase involved in cell wall biosynthesis